MIADMSPSHLSGAKTSKKRNFMFNTEEDEDLDSQDYSEPILQRKKTKLTMM